MTIQRKIIFLLMLAHDTKLVGSQFFTLLTFPLYRHPQYSEYFYLWVPRLLFGPIKFLRFLHILRLFSSPYLKKKYLIVYCVVCLCWYSEGSENSSFHVRVSIKYRMALKLCWHPQRLTIDSDLLKNLVLSNQ